MKIRNVSLLMSSVAISALAAPAHAQDESERQASNASVQMLLDQITVTARKREEGLQEAPLSVSAFSGEQLDARGATNITDLGKFTPNLTIQDNPASGAAPTVSTFIRGIGQRDFLGTLENGVGLYLDGVYIARTLGAGLNLVDIERVEVLRGPQGTLFGRNNVGGAVSIVTKKPEGNGDGYLEATFGTDNRLDMRGSYDVALTDTLFAKLSVGSFNQDGYVDVLNFAAGGQDEGIDLGDENSFSAAAAFRFIPNDVAEFNLSFDYTRERENGPAIAIEAVDLGASGVALFNGAVSSDATCNATPAASTALDCYNSQYAVPAGNANFGTDPFFSNLDTWGATLNAEFDLGKAVLKSITGYRDLDGSFSRDADGSPVQILHLGDTFDVYQISQELQVSADVLDDRLHLLLGGYFFKEDGNNFNPVDVTNGTIFSGSDFGTETFAVFGQAIFDITDQLSLTGGLRYTDETKFFSPDQTLGDPVVAFPPAGFRVLPLGDNEQNISELTPMVTLSYAATDDVNLYATYSEGFRSGGFVQRIAPFSLEIITFDPEFVSSYEIGAKTTIADNFTFNIAGFYSEYTDLQVRAPFTPAVGPPLSLVESNAADAEIWGIEVETRGSLTETTLVEASYSYISAEYKNVEPGANVTATSEFDFVPEHSFAIGVLQNVDLAPDDLLTLRADWSWRSDYFTDITNDPGLVSPGVHDIDLSATWRRTPSNISVRLAVENVLDNENVVASHKSPSLGGSPVIRDRGRQVMITLRKDF